MAEILKVYSVHDSAAEAFMVPFYMQTDKQAQRAFGNSINDANHQFSNNPEDYTLFFVGHFNDQDGRFEPADPRSIGNGIQFKEPEQS